MSGGLERWKVLLLAVVALLGLRVVLGSVLGLLVVAVLLWLGYLMVLGGALGGF